MVSRAVPKPSRDFDLSGVPKTLLLPLWGRAQATLSGSRILSDPKAAELVPELRADFERVDRALPESNNLVSIARARALDDLIRGFLAQHPRGTVVNLGAGLDTSFWRIDNGRLTWFDVDIPEVIEIRRRLLSEGSRNRCIASSFLEPAWTAEVSPRPQGLFLFAGGVFVYLRRAELRSLFSILVESFPGADLAFDIQSKLSMVFGNLVLRRAGMGSARMRWGARSAISLHGLHACLEPVEEFPLFSRLPDDAFPDEGSLRRARAMDQVRAMTIVHMRLQA